MKATLPDWLSAIFTFWVRRSVSTRCVVSLTTRVTSTLAGVVGDLERTPLASSCCTHWSAALDQS